MADIENVIDIHAYHLAALGSNPNLAYLIRST